MIEALHHVLAAGLVMANGVDGSNDSVPGWLLAAGPLGAVAVYTALFRYYRNTDKRNNFERETSVAAKPITGGDQKVNEVRGTRDRRIKGDNVSDYRQRVQRIPVDPPSDG